MRRGRASSQKLGLNLHHNDSHLFPVNVRADTGKVVCLCCVIELEVDRIIHMAELVDIIETYL